MSKINIGCGEIYHPDWINLDIASDNPLVLAVDITRGLPFNSETVTACYSSHVLEHMDHRAARLMLDECFRVLASGGVLRLAVPDLEAIAREYLTILDRLVQGDTNRAQDYEWIMLEMYDQVARNRAGGEMSTFLTRLDPSARGYIVSRIGGEAERIWGRAAATENPAPRVTDLQTWRKRFNRYRLRLARLLVRLVAGRAAATSLERGVFRDGGEVHQWMYDRYSLGRLLEQVGFTAVQVCSADESRIPGFVGYDLDTEGGKVRKPDSLFIEALKP